MRATPPVQPARLTRLSRFAVALSAPVLAVLLGAAAPAALLDDGDDDDLARARDYGATLEDVDAARAAGDYREAERALKGYMQRWRDRGIEVRELDAIHAQLERFVRLRTLLEEAATSDAAAARYLSAVVTHAEPSAKAQEHARALALLARHNPSLRALFERAFPAKLVVLVDPPPDAPAELVTVQVRNSLVDLTRNQQLRLWGDGGRGTLTVRVMMRENDRRNSILEGTAMRSFAVHVVAELVDADGAPVTTTAFTTALLGINAGNASTWGQSRIADRIYTALLDELARQVERGALTR